MTRFNWRRFCDSQNVNYVTGGPNVRESGGHIAVRCPFCGTADPSEHMTLQLSTGFWYCFRNKKHSGRRPQRLIMRLLGCSYEAANSYVGEDEEIDIGDYEQSALAFSNLMTGTTDDRKLEFPDEFKKLTAKGRGRMYVDYLIGSRGFGRKYIGAVCDRYDLMYCDRGYWRGRIIIPMYVDGKLMSWTGRTVYPEEEVRYMSLSVKADANPRALASTHDIVFNCDHALSREWKIVMIVEGPMDVIKVDYYGRRHEMCAVGMSGTGITSSQIDMISEIRDNCDHLAICGDESSESNVLHLTSSLAHLSPTIAPLPLGPSDPGELTSRQVARISRQIAQRNKV